MKAEDVSKKLIEILIENFPQLEEYQERLQDTNCKLADDLQLDSFAIVTLQVAIEDNFDILFDPLEDDFVEIFCTIGHLVRFIAGKYEVL